MGAVLRLSLCQPPELAPTNIYCSVEQQQYSQQWSCVQEDLDRRFGNEKRKKTKHEKAAAAAAASSAKPPKKLAYVEYKKYKTGVFISP